VLVHQGVRVEEVVATLEENERQLGEEGLEMGADDFLILLVDEGEDDITGLESVRPLLHLESELNLRLAELKEVFLALGVVELHGVGNLRVNILIGVLLGLDQLLEMVVQGVG